MTLRERFTWGYGTIMVACILLVGALAQHEFYTEAQARRELGVKDLPGSTWGDIVEVLCYSMIPVVLGVGWWLMRRTLRPIDDLTRAVAQLRAENLREPLPRTGNQDEIDLLAEVFNAMRERLDQSFQQVREFTLHASHELKTPLTVMRAELETALQMDRSYSLTQRETLHNMLDEVSRLTKIVDTLTLLTKADAGQVKLERAPVRLAELVRESFEDAQILAESSQVKVSLNECADVEVVGDRHRLRQLLLNLVDNAIKYNRESGTVTISLRQNNGSAEFEIANTGEGIPREFLPRVFDRFVRSDEARARTIEGCGLGLTIAQWIAQAHGGTIQIESDPGLITTARICLPLVNAKTPPHD
jgi:signal transduction histidine kinase